MIDDFPLPKLAIFFSWMIDCSFIHLYRLFVRFLYGTWAWIGAWVQNGLRHVYWTMIRVLTTETGPMEQVLLMPLGDTVCDMWFLIQH